MDVPSFSVILPTYNRAFIIKSAIDSVLKQVYNKFELIVVDDGSTDQTEQLIKKTYNKELQIGKIKYIKNAHLGVCAARNIGLQAAKNDWIAYIDSDNIMFDEALGTFATFIRNNPQTLNFYGSMIAMSSKKIYGKTFNYEKLKEHNFIDLGTYVHHKSLIDECGKFDETLKKYVDWDLILRQCYLHTPIYVNTAVLYYNDSIKFKRITTQERKAENFKKVLHNIEVFEKQQSVKPLQLQQIKNTIQIEQTPDIVKNTTQTSVIQDLDSPVFFKIIIPNYNNITYIKKCLDSVLTQSFQDFKVIIVDDLSTDSSDNVCKAYARKFPDKIIFQSARTKGYAGKCRNIGLEYPIKSKYILFLDSDDWFYNTTVLHDLANSIAKHNFPDIIHCNSFFLRQKRQLRIKTYDELCECQFCAAPWQYCIKSSLSTITFKENRPKNNDNVWFLNLANEFESHTVFYYQNPVCVYNNCSSTSCQNSNLMFTKKNIFSSTVLLLNDILPIPAKTILAQKFKQRVVENRPKMLKKLLGNRTMPKQLNIDAVLKNSFATSIDDDRFARLNLVFSAQKLQCPTKMPGIQNADLSPAQNCYQTHVKIVQYAKTHNLPFVMIFEDDAYPCKNCYDEFQDYLNLVPNDAELLIFGWIRHVNIRQFIQTTQKFDKPFNKIQTDTTQIWGAHAYLLFASAYDKYLKYAEDHPKNEQPDGLTYNIFNSYITDKPLFIQYNSSTKSLIHKTNTNYLYYGSHDLPPQNFDIVENYLYTSKMYNEKLGTLEKLTDKIKHIMKFGHLMPNKTLCADKIKVHEYCKTVLGKDICIPIIRIYNSIDEINLSVLPQSFVIKANHGCGYNLIVKNKSAIDENYVKMLASKWINDDFSRYQHEMQYKLIPHKIFAEQFMFDGHADSLTDYKFLCFNGKPTYCQVINDRHNSKRRLNYYDMDFNFVDICRLEFPNNKQQLDSKPKKWEEMKSIAQKLSSNFDFVRVDLYEINGVVYLGEMTFTPGAGLIRYKNPNDDIRLGKLLKLSKLI